MTAEINPEEHLNLIYRVINQMQLRDDLAEEAFSESLVAIVVAARNYKPERGPAVNWLANNIRWSIHKFLRRERGELYRRGSVAMNPSPMEKPGDRLELEETINELPASQRLPAWANACGYSFSEIAAVVGQEEALVKRGVKRSQKALAVQS